MRVERTYFLTGVHIPERELRRRVERIWISSHRRQLPPVRSEREREGRGVVNETSDELPLRNVPELNLQGVGGGREQSSIHGRERKAVDDGRRVLQAAERGAGR